MLTHIDTTGKEVRIVDDLESGSNEVLSSIGMVKKDGTPYKNALLASSSYSFPGSDKNLPANTMVQKNGKTLTVVSGTVIADSASPKDIADALVADAG